MDFYGGGSTDFKSILDMVSNEDFMFVYQGVQMLKETLQMADDR